MAGLLAVVKLKLKLGWKERVTKGFVLLWIIICRLIVMCIGAGGDWLATEVADWRLISDQLATAGWTCFMHLSRRYRRANLVRL